MLFNSIKALTNEARDALSISSGFRRVQAVPNTRHSVSLKVLRRPRHEPGTWCTPASSKSRGVASVSGVSSARFSAVIETSNLYEIKASPQIIHV